MHFALIRPQRSDGPLRMAQTVVRDTSDSISTPQLHLLCCTDAAVASNACTGGEGVPAEVRSLSHARHSVRVPQGCTAAMKSRYRPGLGVSGVRSVRKPWTSQRMTYL